MTQSRLVLLLFLSACVAGCSQSSAVPSLPEPTLPAKAPEKHSVKKIIAREPSTLIIPKVFLSKLHAQWCVANVGDSFPMFELPQISGEPTKLSTLFGKQATVVIFWNADRWMSRMALDDLVNLVANEYDSQQIAVVGIAVRQPAGAVRHLLNETNATFPQLLDTNGDALAQVGSIALPRIYVLDPKGNIVWFDIEYSESTRRELTQALSVLAESTQQLSPAISQ